MAIVQASAQAYVLPFTGPPGLSGRQGNPGAASTVPGPPGNPGEPGQPGPAGVGGVVDVDASASAPVLAFQVVGTTSADQVAPCQLR